MMILSFNESLPMGNSKEIYLVLVVFHNLNLGKWWEVMAMFHLLKVRTSIDIFSAEKCKATFGLKYI